MSLNSTESWIERRKVYWRQDGREIKQESLEKGIKSYIVEQTDTGEIEMVLCCQI